ncbi:hypothetical protein B0F90DRAFT_1807864 [Multifurca ochricompacta]|uniref:Kinase n=1 Tax=Multifurca ochricompacta TaxID=376703 RepID=A0AAD4MBW3_9AGAM|nr:hypothetical protein B0F90DRAFT_1807864 [Multifurca ochricompacta]
MADEQVDSTSLQPQPLAYQVGGHKGIQTTGDGTLLIKPALPLELQFYQNSLIDPALALLRPWVPTYLGTLRLEGKNTVEGLTSVEGIPELSGIIQLLVIENVTHGFRKPNVLDVKLGTVLYDEDAPPEKRERMQNTARRTTSGETGIRLTGFQVFGNSTSQPIVIPKSYGKSIGISELPTGIARFFPVNDSMIDLPGTHSGERMDVGLQRALLLPILRFIRKSVQEIRDVLSTIELRMVGSSLLIIYEGDWDCAEMGVQWLATHSEIGGGEGEWRNEGMKGEYMVGDGQDFKEEEEEEEVEDSSEEMEGEDRPCVVRLIDFAHTRLKPGEGPDLGVLRGLQTVLNLLDARIADVDVM